MNQTTQTAWQPPHASAVSHTIASLAVDVAKARVLFPPTAAKLRELVDKVILQKQIEATDEEARSACRETGKQWMDWEASQDSPPMTNRTHTCDVITASAGASLPFGASVPGGKTNHPGRPDFDGQIGVFRSPFDATIWLVDVASTTESGELQWVALRRSDDRYGQAIDSARAGEPLCVASPPAREVVVSMWLISELLERANAYWENLSEADREKFNAFHVDRASLGATLPAAARAAASLATAPPPEFQELYEMLRGTWKTWYLVGSAVKFVEKHQALAFASVAKIIGYRNATVLPSSGDGSAGWLVGTMDPEGAERLKLIADGRF